MIMLVMRRARLRVKRRIDCRDRGAEARRHLLQHVIAPNAQPLADDLHVGVAVAEMPGKLHECERRPGAHLRQVFGLAGNQHDPTIVEHDAVAVAQRHGLVEVQQEFRSAFTLQHNAAAMPVARVEHDEVGRVGWIPEASAANSPAALHGCLPSAHNGADKIVRETSMSKPNTLQGKYSAAGEGNVYARATGATCQITASDTNGTFEIFDEQCKPGFESRLHMHTKSFQV